MKKLFDKDQIWFAVLWIVVYVVGFSGSDILSVRLGVPMLITVVFGAVLAGVLYGFARKYGLMQYFGLCRVRGCGRGYLWFVPLLLISSINLWNGVTMNFPVTETVCYVVSMCFVGFLEELIFRGFLFKGLCKYRVNLAIMISSLTFGFGHIVNLLLGRAPLDTLLQILYASAIGFCYTAIFYVGGSILPCIASHAIINTTSAFAVGMSKTMNVSLALAQTALSVGYGLWLLHGKTRQTTEPIHV